jgi:hypothetical protein
VPSAEIFSLARGAEVVEMGRSNQTTWTKIPHTKNGTFSLEKKKSECWRIKFIWFHSGPETWGKGTSQDSERQLST